MSASLALTSPMAPRSRAAAREVVREDDLRQLDLAVPRGARGAPVRLDEDGVARGRRRQLRRRAVLVDGAAARELVPRGRVPAPG